MSGFVYQSRYSRDVFEGNWSSKLFPGLGTGIVTTKNGVKESVSLSLDFYNFPFPQSADAKKIKEY